MNAVFELGFFVRQYVKQNLHRKQIVVISLS